nr:MAG TPA: hypothetical protein [Caudoviricetes sp.]
MYTERLSLPFKIYLCIICLLSSKIYMLNNLT